MTGRPRNVRAPRGEPAPADSPHPPAARGATSRPPPRTPSSGGDRWAALGALLRTSLGVVVVLSASVGVAWGAKRYMLTSPRFSVQSVVVEGNARLSPEEVVRASGVRVGDNVFSTDLDGAKAALEADPWIRTASVTRKLPGSVVMQVVEHEPAIVVAIGDHLFLASRAGAIFKEVTPDDPLDFPVLTGIEAEAATSDREGAEKRVMRALELLDELQRSSIVTRYPVQEIHVERDGSFAAVVGRDGIVLALGHPPYRGKLEQAERVFLELGKRKAQPTTVFLDNEGSPERVVVRMR